MSKIISPHVSIYKFPVTALSSISVRLSGLYLTGLFISGGIATLMEREKKIAEMYKNLNPLYKSAFNYSVILPVTYHTYGGMRHFLWDKYPKFLNNKSVARSSYLLFGLTGLTSYFIENKLKESA